MITHLRRCTLALTLLLAPAAHAGTLFVDASLASGADDGSSWANAFQGSYGLQNALAASQPGDTCGAPATPGGRHRRYAANV